MSKLQINRPNKIATLNKDLDSNTFRDFYYTGEELTEFCRRHRLPVSGGKIEVTERIAHYLETGKVLESRSVAKRRAQFGVLTETRLIESDFSSTEAHRAFFKSKIGRSFSFNVSFQDWLKNNSGKTYSQAIEAYYDILAEKRVTKTTIGPQFEYNTYIRDYFADNKTGCLSKAITCWKYKKKEPGHNRYEKEDLAILEKS